MSSPKRKRIRSVKELPLTPRLKEVFDRWFFKDRRPDPDESVGVLVGFVLPEVKTEVRYNLRGGSALSRRVN